MKEYNDLKQRLMEIRLTFRAKCTRIGFQLVKDYNANGEICNSLPMILYRQSIFLTIDLSGKEAHLVCKEQCYLEKSFRKKYHPEVLRLFLDCRDSIDSTATIINGQSDTDENFHGNLVTFYS
ncbi:uncharacterized protein LOC122534337 [Frieseomelitta varia]|uniref:uncharacterized protein LOC122534337 n=1 Tax=Frieseomelitta varia TaxID=561572 RepID=UPI001CB67AC7|nr:uncharacterized protein LOC122534337 [Frieseomelitta varia]